MALFYLLLHFQIPFHVAHVDHGWRKESKEEATLLSTLCQEKGIPFHLEVLEPTRANQEAEARSLRLQFFSTLIKRESLEAVVLGHHRDDQTETVLKRVFEGASLAALKGMRELSFHEGVALWRPLLKISKQEILDWLKIKKIPFFVDPTNLSSSFLRGRMRRELLPLLSQVFGKQIDSSLWRLSSAAYELYLFVEELLTVYRKRMVHLSGQRLLLDCTPLEGKSLFEWKCVVGGFLKERGVVPTSATLETLILHLQKKSRAKRIKIQKRWAEIHLQTLTLTLESQTEIV